MARRCPTPCLKPCQTVTSPPAAMLLLMALEPPHLQRRGLHGKTALDPAQWPSSLRITWWLSCAGQVKQEASAACQLHPLWREVPSSRGAFYLQPVFGLVSLQRFPPPPPIAGGMLADEMVSLCFCLGCAIPHVDFWQNVVRSHGPSMQHVAALLPQGLGKTVELLALVSANRFPGIYKVRPANQQCIIHCHTSTQQWSHTNPIQSTKSSTCCVTQRPCSICGTARGQGMFVVSLHSQRS